MSVGTLETLQPADGDYIEQGLVLLELEANYAQELEYIGKIAYDGARLMDWS